MSTTHAHARILLLAQHGDDLSAWRSVVQQLVTAGGHVVRCGYLDGTSASVPQGSGRHRVSTRAARSGRSRAGWKAVLVGAVGAGLERGPQTWRTSWAVRFDPWLRRAARDSTVIVPVGTWTPQALSSVSALAPGVPVRPDLTPEVLAGQQTWWTAVQEQVGRILQGTATTRGGATDLLQILEERSVDGDWTVPSPLAHTQVQDVAELCARGVSGTSVPRMLRALRARLPAASVADDRVLAAALAFAELGVEGETGADVGLVAAGVLREADLALEHDRPRAARLARLGLELLCHRELHSDSLSSSLVDDPQSHLQSWRESRVYRRMVSQRSGADTRGHQDGARDQRTVTILPGAYPRFHGDWLHALEGYVPAPRVLDLGAAGPEFTGMALSAVPIEEALLPASERRWEPSVEAGEVLANSDLVVADWADAGAVWATLRCPPGARIVVRVHTVDLLRGWCHLLDWSRVSDVVFVSAHMQQLGAKILGDALDGVRQHVVPPHVDRTAMRRNKTPGAARTLAVIGYAQRVKDPLWALDLLARLRQTDDGWKLLLVGGAFPTRQAASGARYHKAFRERLESDAHLSEAVTRVPFTDDLPSLLTEVGFVVSSSRREGFGVALCEAAASGAVPVVRNWPMLRSLDAARGLYPPEWVVDTVEQGAARILRYAAPQDWAREQANTRRLLDDVLGAQDSGTLLRQVLHPG